MCGERKCVCECLCICECICGLCVSIPGLSASLAHRRKRRRQRELPCSTVSLSACERRTLKRRFCLGWVGKDPGSCRAERTPEALSPQACGEQGCMQFVAFHSATMGPVHLPCPFGLGGPAPLSSSLPLSRGSNCEVTVWILAGFDLGDQPWSRAGGCTCTDAFASKPQRFTIKQPKQAAKFAPKCWRNRKLQCEAPQKHCCSRGSLTQSAEAGKPPDPGAQGRMESTCWRRSGVEGRLRQPEAESYGAPSCESVCCGEEQREVLTTVSKAMLALRLLTVCK